MRGFRLHCAVGIEPNLPRLKENLERSLMLVTALNPQHRLRQRGRIAKKAHKEGKTLKEVAGGAGLLTPEQFDQWVRRRR